MPPPTIFAEYDPRYPAAFGGLVDRVHETIGPAHLEHIGSTAVPGLGGRRTIDAVVVDADPERRAEIVDRLRGSGQFDDARFGWIEPTLTTWVEVAGAGYPVLLYVLSDEDPVVRGWLSTRDYLRVHPDEVFRYEAAKREALAAGDTAPWEYQQAKTPYLEALARRAEASEDPRP